MVLEAGSRWRCRHGRFRLWLGLIGPLLDLPSASLAVPVLKKVVRDKANGIVCLPAGRAASFWHLIAVDGAHINGVFQRVIRGRPRLIAREDIQSDTFRGYPTFALLFLELDTASKSPWQSLKGQGRWLGDFCLWKKSVILSVFHC